MGTKFISKGVEVNTTSNNVNNIIYNDTQTLKGKLDEVDGEIVGINDDISHLKGYPYLQNTTISEYLDNNFPQNSTDAINIRFIAVSSDNVGDLPTSSAYHISATRNVGASPWCLEATEVITNGFKKFIGYKGTGNDIVWQEMVRKSDLDSKIKITDLQLFEDVEANVVKNTWIPYSSNIDLNKVISTTITWNNPLSNNPTHMVYYRIPIQMITHKWDVTQKVHFLIRIAYFE